MPYSVITNALSVFPKNVVTWLAGIVSAGHKELAFVMGVLASFGVVPTTNKTTASLGAVLLLAYSAVTTAAEKIGRKP